jgi:hypothetical protein
MINIDYTIDADEVLTVRVDLKQRFGRSSTNKTVVIASSEGNQTLWDGTKQRHERFSMAIYIKPQHNTRGEKSEGDD